ncbi:MAG: hypothetical protein AAGC81_08070 [Pseudomonadota bacterium]
MDWTKQINAYCERMSAEFWAEPVNALTNLAFIVAGIGCLIYARIMHRRDGAVTYLGVLICVIGVGSFLFHTFATRWAALADTGPIMIFILSFFTIAMNRFLDLSWAKAGILTIGFLAALIAGALMTRGGGIDILVPGEPFSTQTTVFWVALSITFATIMLAGGTLTTAAIVTFGFPTAALLIGQFINLFTGPLITGWQPYFPAFLALMGVGLYLFSSGHDAWPWLVGAAAIFAVSLTFRTLDQPVCGVFPMGTHFLWHVLNAAVLGTLILGVIEEGREVAE